MTLLQGPKDPVWPTLTPIDIISNYIFNIFIVYNTGTGNCTSNEFKCQEPEMEVENNSYVLKDKCISQDTVNDGRPDCEDRSDEFGI